jgi:mRNA-degrading endonuclease RelE of RelBE toxin-antitoxin system
MNFEILWDPKAVSQLRKLPKEISARIVKKVKLVGETGIGIEVMKEHEYGFKIHIGDYRVLVTYIITPGKSL